MLAMLHLHLASAAEDGVIIYVSYLNGLFGKMECTVIGRGRKWKYCQSIKYYFDLVLVIN